jgi:hypothetical protein
VARSKVEIAGDALFAELTARLGFEPQSYRGNVFNGRSTERLVDLVAEGRGVPDERCRAVPWWFNGDLDALDGQAFDPLDDRFHQDEGRDSVCAQQAIDGIT